MCVYEGKKGGLAKVRCDTVWAKAEICHGCHCCLAMRRRQGDRSRKEVCGGKKLTGGREEGRKVDWVERKPQNIIRMVTWINISREPGARVLSALNPKKPTFLYFYARATHICPCGCVCVCAHHKRLPNSSNTKKVAKSFVLWLLQPKRDPLTPRPLTWKLRPFGAAISWVYKGESGTEGDRGWKWRGKIINCQHNDRSCVRVQPSVLERSTSKDLTVPQATLSLH